MIKYINLLLITCAFNLNAKAAVNTLSCDNVGMADSYVLALSSQPGFCETYGLEAGKPECLKLSRDSYAAKHLVLHGLWPNQNLCGQNYGFCGIRPKSNHCDYSPLNLSTSVSDALKKIMPSYQYGSCLERHEWNKHGSCQILSEDDYFALASRLAFEADESAFVQYIHAHQGEKVKLSKLQDLVEKDFGNKGKVYFGCKNGILVDIFFYLPALIPYDEPLNTLVSTAKSNYTREGCPAQLFISNFNKNVIL